LERDLRRFRGRRPEHVIIVGGPGTGKTTLTRALARALGEAGLRTYVIRDWAREVILEQKACGGRLLPWVDRVAFEREVVRRHVREYEALYLRGGGAGLHAVLEDGSPFIAPAYAAADGVEPDEWIVKTLRRWEWVVTLAVVTTPLPRYGTDNARWECRDYALRIHEEIRKHIVRRFGGRVMLLRSMTPEGRVAEVLRSPRIRRLLGGGVRA